MYALSNKVNDIQYEVIDKKVKENRSDIYNLWYNVYCREMGRNILYADHKNCQITDSLEPHSYIIVAKIHNIVIGSFRINLPEDGDVSYYNELYNLDAIDKRTIGIGTRYMVLSPYRGLYISQYMMAEAFRLLSEKDKKTLIIDCSPAVFKLFEKMGFADLLEERRITEYGSVRIMKYDIKKLKKNNYYIVGE